MWRRAIISVIVPCTKPLAQARAGPAPQASGSWRRRTDERLRRGATSPGSSAPTPGIRPRANRTGSIAQNLAKGQTGLSIAFDLPTQTGLDSDHPLARGEVGKVGVAISHIGDMRALFEEIPLASMNTSMTINATAPWLMALYIAIADEQGAPRAELQGTTQNDIIKEYLARGAYVFPPDASLRLTKDLILFCARETPKWNPMNVCSYHLQEAGATPVQELAMRWRRRSPCSSGCASRARSTRRASPRSSGGCRSSSTPACASSPSSPRCGPSSSCGTRSPATASASPIRRSAVSATACRSTRSA